MMFLWLSTKLVLGVTWERNGSKIITVNLKKDTWSIHITFAKTCLLNNQDKAILVKRQTNRSIERISVVLFLTKTWSISLRSLSSVMNL